MLIVNNFGIEFYVKIHTRNTNGDDISRNPVVSFYTGDNDFNHIPKYSYYASDLLEHGVNELYLEWGKQIMVLSEENMKSVIAFIKNYFESVASQKPISFYNLTDKDVLYIYRYVTGSENYVMVGLNDCKPKKYKVYFTNNGEYFNFQSARVFLSYFTHLR